MTARSKVTNHVTTRNSRAAKLVRMKRRDDATPEVPIPATHAAQQVAYAWQVAARELRFTHPELHEQLTQKVRKLLDVEVLDDPALEIHGLQTQADAMRRDLEELRQALADAVPGIDSNVPAAEAARLRMRRLIDAGSNVGAIPAAPQKRNAEPEEIAPTHAVLQAVADGTRKFTREEREWCVTEAMVLTGFTRTPVQLIEAGEPALARILLEGDVNRS